VNVFAEARSILTTEPLYCPETHFQLVRLIRDNPNEPLLKDYIHEHTDFVFRIPTLCDVTGRELFQCKDIAPICKHLIVDNCVPCNSRLSVLNCPVEELSHVSTLTLMGCYAGTAHELVVRVQPKHLIISYEAFLPYSPRWNRPYESIETVTLDKEASSLIDDTPEAFTALKKMMPNLKSLVNKSSDVQKFF
jgi:hypothetical protein